MLVIILPSTAGEWMLMLLLLLARKTDSQDLIEGIAPLTNFQFLPKGIYQGDLKSRLPHGKGFMVYYTDDADGRYNYTGLWEKAKPHGEGTTIFRNGNVHTGSYQNGLPQGRGVMNYRNGNVFEGFYDKGVQKGSGSIKYANGTRRDGEWKGGKLHGFAFFHYNGPDSPTVERWNNGLKLSSLGPQDNGKDEGPLVAETTGMITRKSFSSPGDHRRSLSVKSFRFPPEILDRGGIGGDEHAFQVSKDDLSRRKQLFESVHSR